MGLGFIKSTDHQPTNHRPTDHRPTEHRPLTNRPTDTLTTDPKFTDLPKRLYFKDLMIKKYSFYRIQRQLGKFKTIFRLVEPFSIQRKKH